MPQKAKPNDRLLLIVDDEPDIREVIKHIADQAGIPNKVAKSGQEAFEIFQKFPVTAILSDMSMPNGDGISMLFSIRSTGSPIPCAFLTAFETKEYLQDALRLGAFEFMSKPFEISAVDSLLGRLMALGVSMLQTPSPVLKENAFHQAVAFKKLLKNVG